MVEIQYAMMSLVVVVVSCSSSSACELPRSRRDVRTRKIAFCFAHDLSKS
jgi:hypothetical protein